MWRGSPSYNIDGTVDHHRHRAVAFGQIGNVDEEKLFGTIIPDAIVARMEAASDPAAEGRAICVDLIRELSEVPGVAGVHIMAPNNDAAVPEVIREARAQASRLK